MAKKVGFAAMPKAAMLGGAQGKAKASATGAKKATVQGKVPMHAKLKPAKAIKAK